MVIETMKKCHIDEIAALEELCFTTPWHKSSFEDELKNDLAHYFVALENGRVIGYCGFWQIFDEAHITNIAVSPDFRRNGVGKALLGKMFEVWGRMGINFATLEVRVSNIGARKLYESFDFYNSGVRKGYYEDTGEDAIIMWGNYSRGDYSEKNIK
ncbi:MAG: ribosomal protein S18-alanine N-acetyltransferase [Clostridiales bacterium]|jgi:ribosomal-protein-alanine N-acetyltransferase|nr:ribosomal protein S18-alanine N-acetyltransferase [Clostridiales bacterium]